MGTARKIIDRQDLARIHGQGEGFVFYPFGRKAHSARCRTVPSMALNPKEPRWFAPDLSAARAYQTDRLVQYPTAKPFSRVGCCGSLVPDEALIGNSNVRSAMPSALKGAASPGDSGYAKGQPWTRRTKSDSFELWTIRRTPYETDQSPQQRAMVREIAPLVAKLCCSKDERLHGVFISDELRTRQPDAENIVYYNFGSAPFAGCGPVIAFERSYDAAPEPPTSLEVRAPYYHRWSVVPAAAPFDFWVEDEVLASWADVPIDLGGDVALAAWRAMRENATRIAFTGSLGESDRFGIDVTLATPSGRAPSAVKAVKGLVDGPLAGLQRADTLDTGIIQKLMGKRWGQPIDESTLRRLITSTTPPTLLPRPPFNLNGLDPCDELCVAGIARITDGAIRGLLSGKVFRVRRR